MTGEEHAEGVIATVEGKTARPRKTRRDRKEEKRGERSIYRVPMIFLNLYIAAAAA